MSSTTQEGSQQQSEGIFTQSVDAVLEKQEVRQEQGLSEQEVQRRLESYGPNRLQETQQRSWWEIFVEQFKSIVVILLVVASLASFAFGDIVEGIAVLLAVVANTAIGFFTEIQAVRSMEALQELTQVDATVRRDGELQQIDAENVVPGDVLVIEGGDVITADARVIEASKLQVDESPLTGESVPVDKYSEAIEADAELAERKNMLYKGTTITRGAGEAVVVATGMETELGHISELVEEAEDETTPLEKRLDQLGGRLAWLTIAVAAIIGISGLIAGRQLALMVETAIALAVAAIPEGLPIVATVALARGMKRMADHNAIVEKLETVETLGATNIILTDKTGTLTENTMQVSHLAFAVGDVSVDPQAESFTRDDEPLNPQEDPLTAEALRVGVLCGNATLAEAQDDGTTISGDPLEVALLRAGRIAGIEQDALLEEAPEVREVAFDRETTMMATYHEQNGHYYVAVKGAPDAVIEASTRVKTGDDETDELTNREEWLERNTKLAEQGLRMLALACKTVDNQDAEPYEDLIFIGLVGLLDPPRQEIADVLEQCRSAGIRVIMVTGDQPETARNVALETKLVTDGDARVISGKELDEMDDEQTIRDTSIFARSTPEQKLDLITVHQEAGNRVAMTGDGVNDAPALQKADIGIAMGQRGTQAAQEAADMVLQDDAFGTIIVAVKQGRIIFSNIRKFIIFLLSSNLGQIFIVGITATLGLLLPLRPLVILYLNIIIDVFPALALGIGEGRDDVMERPPRDPSEPILARRHWIRITIYSAVIAAAVLSVYFYLLQVAQRPDIEVFTISYLTLAFARLWHVFNMRDDDAPILRNEVTLNPWVWGAVLLSGILILISVYVPFLANIFGTITPAPRDWLFILGASLAALVVNQIGKSLWAMLRSE